MIVKNILFILFLLCLNLVSCVAKKELNPTSIVYKNESQNAKEEIKTSYFRAKLKDFTISLDHFPAKSQNERVRFLILHYTACDMKTAVKTLTEKEVSSHYLISDSTDNSIHLLVTEDKRAWHAGISGFKNFENLNDTSIGIEIVNKGFVEESSGKLSFYDFPNHQIEKVAALSKDIIERYKIDPTFVLGHADITPQRKYDPGPLFPWKKLYEMHQIGAWYDEDFKFLFELQYKYYNYPLKSFILSVQNDLSKYGYQIKPTGIWDEQTKLVIRSFQYHFRPENYDGLIDSETWAILKSLNLKYRNESIKNLFQTPIQ